MSGKPIKVLLIEDSVFAVRHTQKMLAEAKSSQIDSQLECADKLSAGLERLAAGGIDIVLLDLTLPDSYDLDTFTAVHAQVPETPIIVLTGLEDEKLAVEAVHKGAQDYLVKGQLNSTLLKRSILYAIERKQTQEELRKHKEHLEELVQERTAQIKKTNEQLRKEITERKQAEKVLEATNQQLRAGEQELKATNQQLSANEQQLRAEITERKEAEEQISRQTAVLQAINKVFQETLVCETKEQVAYTCINMAEELTGSKYGLIGEVNETGRFDTITYGDLAWAICKMPESKAITLSKNMKLRGIWAQAILKEKSQIVNKPASHPDRVGVPKGHPPITSFLGVPLRYADKTIGMIGLANKEGGYGSADQEAIETLSVAFVEALHRKEAEEDLQEAYTRLETQSMLLVQTEKMSALGTLVAGIAHELNNPMMGILNFTSHCIKHTSEDDQLYTVLQDIEHEAKRCAEIVQNLLTFSHTERDDDKAYEKASLAEILDRVLKLLSYRIEKGGISMTQHIADDTPAIWMKPNSIQQLILNLATNALDALEDSEKKEFNADIRREGDFVRITIADTGCGIAAGSLSSIFDPFFTTKPVGQGTGLGLSVSQGVIKAHGGQITCQSEPGAGTKFVILLPIEKKERSRQYEQANISN